MKDIQITNKHMKICSTSYDIRKMQIKTIILLHTDQNGQNSECWQCQMAIFLSYKNVHSLLVGMQNATATLEGRMAVS